MAGGVASCAGSGKPHAHRDIGNQPSCRPRPSRVACQGSPSGRTERRHGLVERRAVGLVERRQHSLPLADLSPLQSLGCSCGRRDPASSLSSTTPFVTARPTGAESVRRVQQIVARERVASKAFSLARIEGSPANPAKQILLASYRLQVLRIDTPALAAQVVQVEAVRYRTNQSLIGEAVCPYEAPRIAHVKGAVAVPQRGRPVPAAGLWVDLVLLAEAFDCGALVHAIDPGQ